MMNGSKPCSFARRSGADSKAEAAKTAGILFPLTPTLSPRRGRALAPRWKIPTLRLQPPLLCLSFRRQTTTKLDRITKARANVSPSPRGEGWGEGERSKLQPQAHDDSWNYQTSRVPGRAGSFPV